MNSLPIPYWMVQYHIAETETFIWVDGFFKAGDNGGGMFRVSKGTDKK